MGFPSFEQGEPFAAEAMVAGLGGVESGRSEVVVLGGGPGKELVGDGAVEVGLCFGEAVLELAASRVERAGGDVGAAGGAGEGGTL